ncbi:MAG: substrate-binding domain-containing protein, partial [Clostridiales bacterium]|nr:substrate-binding domain-containing protein [Clostridiales bacterium]
NEDESFIFQHDYSAAMRTYFEALKRLGKRNIAYISTADRLRFLADTRGVAYYRCVGEFGMAADDALVVFNDRYDLPSQTIGYLGCQRLLKSGARPDAIFVTNDIAAMGVLRCLRDNGIRCPEDAAVVGCDDIALGRVFVPAISTITVDSVAYGEAIAETMIARIENPEANPYKKVVLEAQPCFRESLCAKGGCI